MRALPNIMVATLLLLAGAAAAQQSGGVLRITHRDSPASLSIHEESTNSVVTPMMAVYNNLVIYDQHVKQNSLDAIRPDLAKSWSWSEDQTKLTFALREGVKWHDGMPFTARDVKCTIDLLLGSASDKLRLNLRSRLVHEPDRGDHIG
jgi:peptide/nickel transport system substrate-binding protein